MALESCTPNSFDGDTAVLMADGTRKPIRDVRVGDRVLATDPVTGRTEARTVTALIVGRGLKHLVAVSVDTGHGSATLTATDHHPFWDDVDHAWVDADDLTSADTLRTPTGSHIRVTATREYDRTQTVYNLTVDTLHTYYVLAGTTAVLVHNCSETTTIHRTSPLERGSSELDEGLNFDHFPRSDDGSYDGAAHFGNEKTATEWAQGSLDTHGVGFQVEVPTSWLRAQIDAGRIEEWEGMTEDHMEYVIPRELFDEFNSFPRSPWSGR
ncbi:HINT domain-containing protein [Frankia sp. AiPs1]|uniref:polymorphic toxin-type HINT domain-containing protein n=1 Tax=Frankia sp. AiPs1 TaxID=573493 RepID=UPI002043B89E|nr:polymorphic toxin-type HINT domain-containing protein [Frankia sp. AiPs1]MCM3922257.1 HINT domain-containing protein [Frankia sp. AiPs1]